MTEQPAQPDPLAPWPTLAERDSGLLPPPEYYEGVPHHLAQPLANWVRTALRYERELAQRVLSRLRAAYVLSDRTSPSEGVVALVNGSGDKVIILEREVDSMSVIDAILGLHPCWDRPHGRINPEEHQQQWASKLVALEQLLIDSGSAWQVEIEFRGLYRRVEAPVVEAWQRARELAEQSGRQGAARFLAEAWKKTYGMHPQPTDGYTAAVKAVEAVAVPVVLPNKPRAIVHQVRTELEKHGNRWRFVLAEAEGVDPGEGSIDVVTTMLDRLLRGETERHGVDGVNRPSTDAEAQAAVHLAAVLVQWFLSGAIQPRTTP